MELESVLAEKTVECITSRPYTSVSPDTCLKMALETLVELDVGCLMIEESGRLVGVFSEWDVLHRVAGNFSDAELESVSVSEVMSRDPTYVYESDSVAAVLTVLALCGCRHVPVLAADDTVAGIVSPKRLAAFLHDEVADRSPR